MSKFPLNSLIVPMFALLPVAGTVLAAPVSGNSWPINPAPPLAIADRGGEEVQAKLVPLADGGFYVSWFDNTDGGYDLRLQRLDGNGNEMWGHGGVLIADRTYSWTTDYGLSVDSSGNALLSVQCCTQNAADERIVAFKVDSNGTQVWGASGIPVSTLGEGAWISGISGTSDGNAVVVWNNDGDSMRAQKLDATGTGLWGSQGVTLSEPATGYYMLADIKPAMNGDAIVSWAHQAGSASILYAQKLASADGAELWGSNGTRISDVGNLQFGYFPKMTGDGQGGAAFAYYDITGNAATVRVQHLDAGGNRLFGNEGLLPSTDTSRNHVNPSAFMDTNTGILSVAWIDTVVQGVSVLEGLYAQRIDSNGTRLFADGGLEIVPMTNATDGTNSLSETVALPAPDGFLVGWVTGNTSATSNPVSVQRIDAQGDFVWNAPLLLKTSATMSSGLDGATSALGYAVFLWSDSPDNTTSGRDVLARNVPYSGEFGDIIFRDGFDD